MRTPAETRIEVRLGERHQRMLRRVLERRSTNVSAFFRKAIEEEERRIDDEEFLDLLNRLRSNPITLPPPEALAHELDEAHCPGIGCDDP